MAVDCGVQRRLGASARSVRRSVEDRLPGAPQQDR
jgi:hypothetical protein